MAAMSILQYVCLIPCDVLTSSSMSTATRLYLIRHGATTLSAEDRFAGAIDVDLSDEGRRQAKALGTRLADDHVVAVYCSPLRRCVDTAKCVADPHGLTPIVRDGLREITH